MRRGRSESGHPTLRGTVVGALVLAASVALAGCTGADPAPAPEPSASPTAVEPSPDTPPELVPGGSAEENRPYFDLVNSTLLADNPRPGGRAVIDNLVTAGFDKSLMQVTADTTAIGRGADSVQFSVRFDSECLIGQSSAAGYSSSIGPAIAETQCLLGITRAIDW